MAVPAIISNHANVLRGATITATSVKPSEAIFRTAITQDGNGALTLSGAYTGADDATLDIEITSTTINTIRSVSDPVYTGSGNPTMTIDGVDAGASSQVITVQLKDLGSETEYAELVLEYGIKLRAASSGASGNSITLSIDRSGLTFGSAIGSLLKPLAKGQRAYDGDEYNFGAVGLDSNGNLPSNVTRITVGGEWPVYRHWRESTAEGWRYYFHPAPPADVPVGALVKPVTGSYTATITDGVTPETHTGTTLYDLFTAIQTNSDLVDVVGTLSGERTPGGMAASDVNLITQARALSITPTGSEYATHIDGFSASSGAPTETLTVKCTNNNTVGAELWDVRGSVAGALGTAITGTAFAAGNYGFTVPRKLIPESVVPRGLVTLGSVNVQANDGTNTNWPQICLDDYRLGGKATDKRFTFTYVARPSADCSCETVEVEGRFKEQCLGIQIEGDQVALTDTDFLYRQQRLQEYYTDKIESNTTLTESAAALSAQHDIKLARLCRNIMSETLQLLFTSTDAIVDSDLGAWAATTAYALNDEIVDSGGVFRATVAGTSGGSSPTFVTTDYGSTTTDNTVTWTYVRKAPLALWDTYLTANETLIDNLDNISDISGNWQPSVSFSIGNVVAPRTPNNYLYRCIAVNETAPAANFPTYTGESGASEPTWPTTAGNTVTDGELTWICEANLTGADILSESDSADGGTSSTQTGRTFSIDVFADRFRAQMAEVEAAAGLAVGKLEASGDLPPSDCWQDLGDPNYWRVVDNDNNEYLPMFNNETWHSAIIQADENGNKLIVSTEEIALKVAIGCSGLLQVGDSFVVTINDAQGFKAYEINDKFEVQIVAGAALGLSGGVTGNDTHTWSVKTTLGGTLPDYVIVSSVFPAYTSAQVDFTLAYGGIDPQLGDYFTVAVEGGQFKYRWDGGGYTTVDIDSTVSLGNGVSANFAAGANPSWSVGDSWSYRVDQDYSPSHIVESAPFDVRHQWSGTSQAISIDLGSAQDINAVLIGLHTIDSGATITLSGGTTAAATDWSEPITWRAGVIAAELGTARNDRYLKLTVSSSTDSIIGWLWAGEVWRSTNAPAVTAPALSYSMLRGQGRNPGSLYGGKGRAIRLEWDQSGWLEETDKNTLITIIEDAKESNDNALCVLVDAVPHVGVIDTDEIEIAENWTRYQGDTAQRVYEASIPLRALLL